MKIYRTPDGQEFEVPDNASPEELAWLQQQGAQPKTPPNVWKDIAKSLVSGPLEGVARAPYMFGDLLNLGVRGVNKVRPGTIDPKYEKLTSDRVMEILEDEGSIYRHLPETTPGKYAHTAGAAFGGAALFGGPRAFVPPGPSATSAGTLPQIKDLISRALRTPGVTAPVAGMAAQGGMDISDGNPAVGFGTGLATQLAMALGGRMMTPNHPNWIRHGTEGMSADDWNQAQRNLEELRQAGARQHTLADAMPETARIRPMTSDLSNTSGGQRLGELLTARNTPGTQIMSPTGQLQRFGAGDIPRLLDEASDAIGPQVNAGTVNNQLAQRGSDLIREAKQTRFNSYMPILENAGQVPQADLARILLAIRQQAGNPQNLGTMDQAALARALESVRRTPLYPMPQPPGAPQMPPGSAVMPPGGPLTALPGRPPLAPPGPSEMGANLVALSKNVKDLKRGIPVQGEIGLDRAAGLNAYRWADEGLKATSPEYARAMQEYLTKTRQLVDPAKQGLPGQFAAMNNPMAQGSANSILQNTPQQEISRTLPQLANTPELRQGLARVIADQNKRPVRVAGPEQIQTDKARQIVTDLVDDPAAKATFASKTRAADTLSRLTAEAGADATVRQNLGNSWVSKILAPIYEMRVRMNLRLSEKEARTLAELIGNPTDANMAMLRKIAQERPDLVAPLRQMGALSAVHTGSTSALIEE